MIKALILFERTGTVRDAFIDAGCYARSVDLQPTTSLRGDHVQGDVWDSFDYEERWDIIIAFPPCT